jgi:ATP:corrinoid adenosyltransferase
MSPNVKKGLLIVHTGDGKGKSTAAFGTLLRAWGRVYRDGLGWVNQRLAKEADQVLFMVAGIPMLAK